MKVCIKGKTVRNPLLRVLTFAFSLSVGMSCVEQPPVAERPLSLIGTSNRYKQSNQAANLMTTAIRYEQNVDIVFFPSSSLSDFEFALVEGDLGSEESKNRILKLYKDGASARFETGSLRGSAIRSFILERSLATLQHDIHVAGLKYTVHQVGGLPQIYQIALENGQALDDDKYYRVAVNSRELDGKFPGYRFRHGFNFSFRKENISFNAKKSLDSYLDKISDISRFEEPRSIVTSSIRGRLKESLKIHEIQGSSHISPFHGYEVTTQGIVTARGFLENGGFEFYLQSAQADDDLRTSEGILVRMEEDDPLIYQVRVGCMLELTAVVYEDLTDQMLTRTSLNQVKDLSVNACKQDLPEAVTLGGSKPDRIIPDRVISSYMGNLNQKESLDLSDGIDFWESLEGMRVRAVSPRVTGLGGGRKDVRARKAYLNLFVVAEGTETSEQVSKSGGLIIDVENDDYNPEIIKVIDHHFSRNVKPDQTFAIGDQFDYDLEGIFGYDINLFGGGEYVLYVTGKFDSLSSIQPLEKRQKTSFSMGGDKFSVASFNVENLAADDDMRIDDIARAISISLNCPDVVNFAEIQDYNGISFQGTARGLDTLEKIIAKISSCPLETEYRAINIDPVQNNEGGEPGGNIRVAMIYNAKRVGFEQYGEADDRKETVILDDGRLSQNPGRVLPNNKKFSGTRKSIISQFSFNGQRVYVIGNHFNSKGGDTSLWSAEQPAIRYSERERTGLAEAIHDYCQQILLRDPNANVVVLGDFNDFHQSIPMKALAGTELQNLMDWEDEQGIPLVNPNDRYTYNYNGNSQTLDFIFVNKNMLKKSPEFEILHINTDHMGQVADHDPIIAQFELQKEQ